MTVNLVRDWIGRLGRTPWLRLAAVAAALALAFVAGCSASDEYW